LFHQRQIINIFDGYFFSYKHKFILISKIIIISKEKIFSIDQWLKKKICPGLWKKANGHIF